MKRAIVLLCLFPALAWGQIKISQLPVGATPTGSEVYPAVQSSNTVKLTLAQTSAYIITQLSASTISNLWSGCTSTSALLWGGSCSALVSSGTFAVPSGFTGTATLNGSVLSLTMGASSQNASLFYATPSVTSGAASWRSIVASDIPPINLASSSNGGVFGTLQPANGGCGQNTISTCLNALLPSQTGQAGNVLTTNGTTPSWGGSTITSVTGTFTGTLTGCTSNPTGTLTYDRTGNIVIIYNAGSAITCTSNSTSMTLTGLPASLIPAIGQDVPCVQMENNSVINNIGLCAAANLGGGNGEVVFALGVVSGSLIQTSITAFTASGIKGIQGGWAMTYALQ